MKVKAYKAKRGSGVVTVSAHEKGRGRNLPRSSCINRVSEGEGGGMVITIRGQQYPYPLLPTDKVSGVVNADSAGRYYNKNIRGKFF